LTGFGQLVLQHTSSEPAVLYYSGIMLVTVDEWIQTRLGEKLAPDLN